MILPSLTIHGMIDNKHLIMKKLWEYFITSDYSQSTSFAGHVHSLRYLIASEQQGNLASAIESALTEMYTPYFSQIEVKAEVTDKETDSKYSIGISVYAKDAEGTLYTLNKELKTSNGNIDKYEELVDELYNVYNRG